jgi:hypothetical protein
MRLCKLCGMDGRSVQAHIIPESMYPFEAGTRKPLLVFRGAPDSPLGRSRVGEYDPALVCEGCESRFNPWDDYAFRLLRKEPRDQDYYFRNGEQGAYEVQSYDYAKLKLFFVSVLWRASETSRPFFSAVSVGTKHIAQLRTMILNKDPGGSEDYSIIVFRLRNKHDAHKSVTKPYLRPWGDERVRFYLFYFFGYAYLIKADQRRTPSSLSRYILRPDEPLRVIVMKFDEFADYKRMVSAVRRHF